MRIESQDLAGALESRPTLSVGHDADLKIETGTAGRMIRVWLVRHTRTYALVDVEVQDPRTGAWVPSWDEQTDFDDALTQAHFSDWERGDW